MIVSASYIKIIKTELIRKSLHFLIALSPVMAALNLPFTLAALMAGVIAFICFESLRLRGVQIPLVSSLTILSSRPRDQGRFVFGPVTLGFGALLTLSFYPLEIASIAIYALAFGDGFAGLIGKIFGRNRPDFLLGKSLEGTIACFFAVLIASWRVCHNLPISLSAAFTAAAVEALPLEEFDNVVLPLVVGLVVYLS
jgi:dolichol kinase